MSVILGTNVSGPVVPFTTDDDYPTHIDEYGAGGWRGVPTLAALDTIPEKRRVEGMGVFVRDTGLVYVYRNGKFELFTNFKNYLSTLVFSTWAELSGYIAANPGIDMQDGFGARVIADDGTHNDPVTGASVPNKGIFRYKKSAPSGFTYVGLLETADAEAVLRPILNQAEQVLSDTQSVAQTAVEAGKDAEDYAKALSVLKIDLPGYAFALQVNGYGLPFLIPDDFSQVLLAGRDIANQITIARVENGDDSDSAVIMDPYGRIIQLFGGTTESSDQYTADLELYSATGYEPIKIIPGVLHNSNTSTRLEDRGAAVNRIPGLAVSPSGRVLLVWEGRTGGDFDPKNIMARMGQVGAGGTLLWDEGGPFIIAHDKGGWGTNGDGENVLGNPTPVWDKVDGKFRLIMYWRRGDISGGDQSTTPGEGADTTTRIYGLLIGTNGAVTDWDGNVFPFGSGRSLMTDLTAAKPQSWGAGSPGPGKGLCTLLGNVWFQMHGWNAGNGSTNPRTVALTRLNRATRRLEFVAQTPITYKPNESGIAEDESTATETTDGNIVVDSRSLGEDARIVNIWQTAEGSWATTARDSTRIDPQAAGDIVTLTGAALPHLPRPFRTVQANNVSKFGNGGGNGGAGERRGLTLHTGYIGGVAGSWKAKRRIYDQITVEQQDSGLDGNVVTETVDCYGKPLVAPAQRKLYTGYPVLHNVPNVPDVLLVAFETQFLCPNGGTVGGIGIGVVPFPQLFQVR